MLDSLVRVSRRAAYDHYASVLAPKGAVLGREAGRIPRGAVSSPPGGGATFPPPFSDRRDRRWPETAVGVRQA